MRVLLVPHTEFVAKYGQNLFFAVFPFLVTYSGVDSGVAGDVRAPPEFWGSEKGQSLISAYWSLVQQAPLDSKSYLRCFHSMYAGITKKNIFGTIF